jgi:hypothetical protein
MRTNLRSGSFRSFPWLIIRRTVRLEHRSNRANSSVVKTASGVSWISAFVMVSNIDLVPEHRSELAKGLPGRLTSYQSRECDKCASRELAIGPILQSAIAMRTSHSPMVRCWDRRSAEVIGCPHAPSISKATLSQNIGSTCPSECAEFSAADRAPTPSSISFSLISRPEPA